MQGLPIYQPLHEGVCVLKQHLSTILLGTSLALMSFASLFVGVLDMNVSGLLSGDTDAANSLITSQVNAGVSVRMAVIYLLLGGEGNVVA